MSWGPSYLLLFEPHLPSHCEPTGPFLRQFSAIFHTCVPTPLALISTILGCLSILAWLFAQLPQIFKNYRLKSTSGLSIYFLVEWCLGDISNLTGALLTHQATWQVIVGAYYCFVDVALVSQWIWYEGLQMGKRIRPFWSRKYHQIPPDGDNMQELPLGAESSAAPHFQVTSSKGGVFPWANYGSMYNSEAESSTTSPARIVQSAPRRPPGNPLPSPSPRTTLLLTMVIALCSINAAASPTNSLEHHPDRAHKSQTMPIGTIISWTSTVLYLLSRLPQLIKNFRRRSTAGLSFLLFLAAFLGNFFYSASLLFNPCLWEDFEAYGGRGWAGPEGSQRVEWMWSALPFFLGAAGVLIMDAAVGLQFWLWGEGNGSSEIRELQRVELAEGTLDDTPKPPAPTGWMRGWVPSGSLTNRLGSLRRFSPLLGPANSRNPTTGEYQSLLGGASQ